ncbi:MAG: outer membrane lipoprotein-sorting protein [Myxococcota bacterium]
MFVRWLAVAVLLVPLAAPAAAPAADPAATPAADWGHCLRESWPEQSLSALLTLTHFDRVGDERASRAFLEWSRVDGGSSLRIEVTEPDDLRGTVLTLSEQSGEFTDIWIRLPDVEGDRRLTGRRLRTPLLGSDLTLEDLRRLAEVVRAPEESTVEGTPLDGRSTWRVAIRPGPETASPYDSIVSQVDRETCVPLRTELSRSDRVRKVVGVDLAWIEAVGGHFVPRRWRIDDLDDGSHTRLTLDLLRVDEGARGARTARAHPGDE